MMNSPPPPHQPLLTKYLANEQVVSKSKMKAITKTSFISTVWPNLENGVEGRPNGKLNILPKVKLHPQIVSIAFQSPAK